VACTRAQDYLILSAALPRDFSPNNSWMLQLAERFDLRTGDFLLSDIPDGHRPRVRVTDLVNAPPVTMPPGELRERNGVQVQFPARARATPRTANRTKPQLEKGLVLLDAMLHFDVEDGSDRTEWVRFTDEPG
jgi:hypothetical protein